MALTIKICGLKTAAALAAAAEAGADLVGLVFFAPSPRDIALAEAAALVADLPARTGVVALTVDADDALIDAIVSAVRPAMIQAHGRESPERIAAIKARTGVRVMKALALGEVGDLDAARPFEGVADRLLFDARPPPGASRPGGHGRAFDWSVAGHYRGRTGWMLSGGLNAGNVAAAVRASGARALDVSSGVERRVGVKDPGLIRAFIAAAREAESEARERA